jgi:hypothetical protein
MARSESFINGPNTLPQTTSPHPHVFAYNRAADHTLLRGRSPHLERRAADYGKESVPPKGRGCFEHGTLNVDRKANQIGSLHVQGRFLLDDSSQELAQSEESPTSYP